MKTRSLFYFFLILLTLAPASCSPAMPALADGAAPQEQNAAGEPGKGAGDCPVTRPPDERFVPPEPWPEYPPGPDRFWYGDADLWTALPKDGKWAQLALGEKSWWWSEHFDVEEDTTPDLVVTARRLDGAAPEFRSEQATNGYHESFHWAMLTGVDLPTPGCWEVTGAYAGSELKYVVWVP